MSATATRPRLVDSGTAFGWPRGIAVADGRRWVASGLANGPSGRLRIDGGPAAAASVPLPAAPRPPEMPGTPRP